jgi:exonuclease VII large subunit
MPQLRPTTAFMLAMLATAMTPAAAPYASAQVVVPTDRNILVQQNELQQLENRLQRQQFQQQQQQYRAQDREIVQQPRPDVPIVRPSCQIQVYGNTIQRNCR